MNIVFEGQSKKGTPIIIRYPEKEDVHILCDFINEVSRECTFIRFQGETITLEEETKYVDDLLVKIAKHETVMLMAMSENKLIGVTDIRMLDKIEKHVGIFGILLAQQVRNQGIGGILLRTVLDVAIKQLPQLEIVTLGVFTKNTLALNWYKRSGFVEYGNLPGGIKTKEGNQDHVFMYKKVR